MSLDLAGVSTFESIPTDECFGLLGTRPVGRIAVSAPRDGPLVVPVNHVLDGRSVLFLTGFGSKLRRVLAQRAVSFEVDDFDPQAQVGWSVLARGRAREVLRRDVAVPLPEPWHPHDKPYLIRLTITTIEGRRISRPDAIPGVLSERRTAPPSGR